MAFFPCIYFTGYTNPCYFTLENYNYKSLTLEEKLDKMLERAKNREYFYELLIKMVGVCLRRGIKLVLEKPSTTTSFVLATLLLEGILRKSKVFTPRKINKTYVSE